MLNSKNRLFQATRITWLSLIGSEEPSLTISHSLEPLCSNSGPNPNCRRYKIRHFIVQYKLYKFTVAVTRMNAYYIICDATLERTER